MSDVCNVLSRCARGASARSGRSSAPIATVDPTDLVSIDKTLDLWTKVTLTKAGLPFAGWIISADLIPVQQATVRLFDEPLGNLVQTVTGRIDVLAKVATWAKVKVTPPDGSAPAVGWTEDVAAARRDRTRKDRRTACRRSRTGAGPGRRRSAASSATPAPPSTISHCRLSPARWSTG